MYSIIAYIILFILLCFLVLHGYQKVKSQFWKTQPVFHYYDYCYYFYKPGIVNHAPPSETKYCNFTNIVTYAYKNEKQNENKRDLFDKYLKMLQYHYLKADGIEFLPLQHNFYPYFENHNYPCYITLYHESEILQTNDNQQIENDKLIGGITSRPINIHIQNNSLVAYYVDYLCVDRYSRKTGVAPQLIQTHEYNQRHYNKEIQISLFKREGSLTASIVPFCKYDTFVYNITKWKVPPKLDSSYHLVIFNKDNIHRLFQNIDMIREIFNTVIVTDIANIINLVESKNIYLYGFMKNGIMVGIYCIRDGTTYYESESIFECISTACLNMKNIYAFKLGFHHALHHCVAINKMKYLLIENISHNYIMIQEIAKSYTPVTSHNTALYFYNFIHKSVKKNKLFMIM